MLMCVMGGLDTLNTSAPSAETVMKLLSSQYRCDLHQTPQQITATQTKRIKEARNTSPSTTSPDRSQNAPARRTS